MNRFSPPDFDLGDPSDWARAHGAGGPVPDAPVWIDALFADEEETIGHAVDRIEWALFHQGARYSGSLTAIPVLARAARHPACRGRVFALGLLVDMAFGPGWAYLPDAPSRPVDAFERALFDAGDAVAGDLEPLADDGDLGVRMDALFLMAIAPSAAAAAEPRLRTALSAEALVERINAALCLAALARRDGRPDLLDALESSARDREPVFAAMLSAATTGASPPEEPRATDLEIALRFGASLMADAPPSHVGELRWEAAHVSAARRLAAMGRPLGRRWVEAAAAALATAHVLDAPEIAGALLSAASARPRSARGRPQFGDASARDLTDDERVALEAIAAHGAFTFPGGGVFANFTGLMRDHGLPTERAALRSWLDGDDARR